MDTNCCLRDAMWEEPNDKDKYMKYLAGGERLQSYVSASNIGSATSKIVVR
jgi:hypothetical protein